MFVSEVLNMLYKNKEMIVTKRPNENRFKYGRVKRIILAPKWILRVKGWLDSFKGETVPNAYCMRCFKKLEKLQAADATHAENILTNDRTQEASILMKSSVIKVESAHPPVQYEKSDRGVRECRGDNAKRQYDSDYVKSGVEYLAKSREHINSIELILVERSLRMRKSMLESLYAYCTGVRRGKLKQYDLPSLEDRNEAYDRYREKHAKHDESVIAYLTSLEKPEKKQEVSQ